MVMRPGSLRGVALATVTQVLAVSAVFIVTSASSQAASAESTRLHDLQWNVCDQKGSAPPGSVCDWTPSQKAPEIERLIEASDWRASIVTLQEICKSTFDLTLARLGSPWTGYFATTVLFPNDTRCRDSGRRRAPSLVWGC